MCVRVSSHYLSFFPSSRYRCLFCLHHLSCLCVSTFSNKHHEKTFTVTACCWIHSNQGIHSQWQKERKRRKDNSTHSHTYTLRFDISEPVKLLLFNYYLLHFWHWIIICETGLTFPFNLSEKSWSNHTNKKWQWYFRKLQWMQIIAHFATVFVLMWNANAPSAQKWRNLIGDTIKLSAPKFMSVELSLSI